MKLMFFSDIHGVPSTLKKLFEHAFSLKPDRLILLGDALYHGPRNGVPDFYDPVEVARLLNEKAEMITAVRGNCDADVDQMLLLFPLMARYSVLLVGEHKFFLTHGHIWHPANLPPLGSSDVLAFGHTHVPVLYKAEDGTVIFNPGSVTLPKSGFPPTFGMLHDDGTLAVYRMDGDWPENPTFEDLQNRQLQNGFILKTRLLKSFIHC